MKIYQGRSSFSIASVAVLAAGCGGGSTSTQTNAQAHTIKSGDAVVTYFGQPKPQLTSSAGTVTVVGQAGATFSDVQLQPPPNLADTYLAFGRSTTAPDGVYIMPYGSASPQLLYQTSAQVRGIGISAYGAILFEGYNTSDDLQAFSIRPDGTGYKSVSFPGPANVFNPQFSVDGTNRVNFYDLEGGLWVAPGTGGTPSAIQSNAFTTSGVWNGAGTEIAYPVRTVLGTDIYETSPSGGASTDISGFYAGSGSLVPVGWCPDGVTFVATYLESGGSTIEMVKYNTANSGLFATLTPSGDSDEVACLSPDGSRIAFYRSGANGSTPGIYTMDVNGANTTLVYPDSSAGGGTVYDIQWSPFLPKETVVAASGSTFYHQAASGFLLSQNGSQFGSMVAFTAKTPSEAAIQAPSTSDQYAPMAFTITADSITSIGYINSYFNPGTTISLSSTPSVVVTVDANTGQVDLVAPAAVEKPASAKNADGTLTYKASFKAIYDGQGKNLALNGASSLTVNPKTGKLVSFR